MESSSIRCCDSQKPTLQPETDESVIPPGKGEKGHRLVYPRANSEKQLRLSEKGSFVTEVKCVLEEHLA